MNVLLRSARIVDSNSKHHNSVQDILIQKGIIQKISKKINLPKGVKEVKLPNLHVSLGWFDAGASFGEPGYEEREQLENGLRTAALSGFTRIAVLPNTNPVIDNKSNVEFLIQKAGASAVSVHPIGTLTKGAKGEELSEMYDMSQHGAIAFYDYGKGIQKANLLKIALLYAQNFKGLVMSFPQETSIGAFGFVNESAATTRLGLNSIPNLSEELQITRDLSLLAYTGGKLHIPTISTAEAVKLIKEAKRKGLDVSCSVSPHHLVLTDEEIQSFDTRFKVSPPLRTEKDRKALVKGVQDGTIDFIVSDHNPIDVEHKKVEFEQGLDGSIGLESLFGAAGSVLDTETIIGAIAQGSRRVFGLETTAIEEGQTAELTLFDPEKTYVFEEEMISSTSKNAALLGKKLKGMAYGIYAKSQLVLKK